MARLPEGATHYVIVDLDGETFVVPLMPEPEPSCEAEGFGSECEGPWWQPLDVEGGPGPCCTRHIACGGPGDVRPLPLPEGVTY